MQQPGTYKITINANYLFWLNEAMGQYFDKREEMGEVIAKLPSLQLSFLPEGTEILKEGETGNALYILFTGTAIVSRANKLVAELTPGDFFGEMGFLLNPPRTASVKAGHDCQVFCMEADDLVKLGNKYPAFLKAMRETAQKRMGKLMQ